MKRSWQAGQKREDVQHCKREKEGLAGREHFFPEVLSFIFTDLQASRGGAPCSTVKCVFHGCSSLSCNAREYTTGKVANNWVNGKIFRFITTFNTSAEHDDE